MGQHEELRLTAKFGHRGGHQFTNLHKFRSSRAETHSGLRVNGWLADRFEKTCFATPLRPFVHLPGPGGEGSSSLDHEVKSSGIDPAFSNTAITTAHAQERRNDL